MFDIPPAVQPAGSGLTGQAPPGVVFMPSAPALEAGAGREPGFLAVTSSGADISHARSAALAQAAGEAAARGFSGQPRIRSESFSGGAYTALLDYRDAAPADPAALPAAPGQAARPASGPSWVLVVPAGIGSDGKARWGRDSEWSRAWIAPQRRAGTRLVATMGDADDHDRFTEALLGDPSDSRSAAAAAALARKYGAPAVAMVRMDTRDGSVGAWLWRYGEATSADGGTAGTVAAGRDSAAGLVADLLGRDKARAPGPAPPQDGAWTGTADEGDGAWVASDSEPGEAGPPARPVPSLPHGVSLEDGTSRAGRMTFRLRVETSDQATQAAARQAVRNVLDLWMGAVRQEAGFIEIDGEWTGADGRGGLVRALVQAGLQAGR